MVDHTDDQLVRALVHEAYMQFQGEDAPSPVELTRTRRFIVLAELLLAGAADDSDRAEVYEILHPSTVHHYLA